MATDRTGKTIGTGQVYLLAGVVRSVQGTVISVQDAMGRLHHVDAGEILRADDAALAAFSLAGHAGKPVIIKATEDGFQAGTAPLGTASILNYGTGIADVPAMLYFLDVGGNPAFAGLPVKLDASGLIGQSQLRRQVSVAAAFASTSTGLSAITLTRHGRNFAGNITSGANNCLEVAHAQLTLTHYEVIAWASNAPGQWGPIFWDGANATLSGGDHRTLCNLATANTLLTFHGAFASPVVIPAGTAWHYRFRPATGAGNIDAPKVHVRVHGYYG